MPAGLRLDVGVGVVDPRDAIAAFQARRLLQPSFRWQEVWQDEHARAMAMAMAVAVAVAGVQRLGVLQVFQDAIGLSLREGRRLADFAERIHPLLAAKGFWGDVEVRDPATGETRITRFDERRLQLIFDVNMRQSHAAGRWARIERTKATMLFLVYMTMRDDNVRIPHRRWLALVLPVDHPFWNTHFPPNGWRCRCYAYATDAAGVERLRAAGLLVQTKAPAEEWMTYVNPVTGEMTPVPRGIDLGFAYNPGKTRDAALYETALRKAMRASPVAVAEATLAHPALLHRSAARFGAWFDEIRQRGHAWGEVQYIGALPPATVRAIDRCGIEQRAAVVAVRDDDVMHALRDAKGTARLHASVYRRLPELLRRTSALLLERGRDGMPDSLLYVLDLAQEDGAVGKLVLVLNYEAKVRVDGQAHHRAAEHPAHRHVAE